MAERTVSVKLIADAREYIKGMDDAVRKTKDSTQSVEQQLAAQERAFTAVGTAATAVGVLALAGVTAAVAAYANFDQAMSGVQAATHATTEDMALLGDAALDAGQRTVFSATESAAAIENLARAGVSTADILGGALDGSLDLAAAGGLEVADAAEIAASALTQFQLKGSDVAHVADLLAAGAGKAQGGVGELGDALNQSGLVAAQMGLSIEETVGSLTAFASAGLIGSDAGTSFRAMLLRLANPTQESAGLMEELGLSFYDAQGDFIGMEGVAGQLQDRLKGLTDEQRNAALAQIFGQDAIRASSILYEEGAEGVREWTEAVDDQGYAAETAAIRLDNLKGDLEALGGAFETLMINLGAGADGPLRGLVQGLTDVVEWLGNLDPAAQTAFLAVLSVVGVVGLVGGAALVAVPQIAAFRGALSTLNITAATTRGTLGSVASFMGGPWGIAIGAAVIALSGLLAAVEASKTSVEEWQNLLTTGMGAGSAQGILDATGEVIFQVDELAGALDRMQGRDLFTEALGGSEEAAQLQALAGNLAEFGTQLNTLAASDFPAASEAFRSLVDDADLTEEQVGRLIEQMPDFQRALHDQATEMGLVTTSGDELRDSEALVAVAMGEVEVASEDAAEATELVADAQVVAADAARDMFDAQQAVVDAMVASESAMAGYEQSVDDIAKAMNEGLAPALLEGGTGFNLAEQSGRDASGMMNELVGSAQAATDAMFANGESAEAVAVYQDRARQQIYDAAIQMGLSEDAARDYANRLLAIPDDVRTTAYMETAAAQAAINRFIDNNTGREIIINQRVVQVAGGETPGGVRYGYAGGYAYGGRIPGYSPGYDDHLGYLPGTGYIGLAGGEWIVNPLASRKYDRLLAAINADALPGFASGGRLANPSFSTHVAAPVVNVAPTEVRMPSTMQARIDIGGQLVDAVMHIVQDHDDQAALDHRLGRR